MRNKERQIEVLRIEQNVVSKELGRFRVCNIDTRCYYCREWAHYIYKKHFVWSAKTQEEVYDNTLESLNAGRFQINMLQTPLPGKRKERSPKLAERFEKLLESNADTSTALMTDIIAACELWKTLPSSLSGLPTIFEPIQFNPFPDAIPLSDDLSDPALILDELIMERQALCLPSTSFEVLKNMTGDILLSQTQATCKHTRPEYKSIAELEIERDILNSQMAEATKTVLEELAPALDLSWAPLSEFLQRLLVLEKERNGLMGEGCQQTVDQFAEQQKLVPFSAYWTERAVRFKKKRAKITEVEEAFDAHVDRWAAGSRAFRDEFALPGLRDICKLIEKLWDLVVPTIQHMADRIASHEKKEESHTENCRAVSASLKGLHSTKEVDDAVERIERELIERVAAYCESLEQLKASYREDCKPGTSGRLEKLANKEFRKKIKKAESGYHSLRHYFQYEVTQKIFPEALFCKFSLVCLEALMQEGEVMEAMTIESEVRRFIESNKDLVRQRQVLIEQFEKGVHTGRRELAGVLGKLFLKEGMRIQGENLALKRQDQLLKSISANTKSSKKKKKKGKTPSIDLPSPQQSPNKGPDRQVDVNPEEVPEVLLEDQTMTIEDNAVELAVEPPVELHAEVPAKVPVEQVGENDFECHEVESNSREVVAESLEAVKEPRTAKGELAVKVEVPVKAERSVEVAPQQEIDTKETLLTGRPAEPEMDEKESQGSEAGNKESTDQGYCDDNNDNNNNNDNDDDDDNDALAGVKHMSQADLLVFLRTLHSENSRLAESVRSSQQEMALLTNQYTEMMLVAQARETQMLQLYKSQQQVEMEEARRYTLSLEAKISALESQLQSGRPLGTAGFGSQDLFASYRHEMAFFQPATAWMAARCGHCGGEGHTSTECKNFVS
ncbi:CCHC-type zinc finger transcription factor [Phycomyces blakesleeanus]|uniref:CCHC-type zinc finger transcription factor n=1 Tax=Phycomyces blakesleeanus TaxID=4837 RepID=A0ABR3AL48_PHYBL